MKTRFDSVIGVLREFSGRAWENASARESCEAAILVLEAAGKMEKVELQGFIHLYLEDLDPNPILDFMVTVYGALPDEEAK